MQFHVIRYEQLYFVWSEDDADAVEPRLGVDALSVFRKTDVDSGDFARIV